MGSDSLRQRLAFLVLTVLAASGCRDALGIGALPGEGDAGGGDSSADAGFGSVVATDTDIGSITVDSANVYWTAHQNVERASLGGGASSVVAYDSAGEIVTPLVHDASSLYWGDAANQIVSAPVGGGNAKPLATGTPGIPEALAVNATSVYWSDDAGYISSVPLAGGATTVLSHDTQGSVLAIAVDSKSVYWLSAAGGIDEVALGGGARTTLLAPGTLQLAAQSELRFESPYLYVLVMNGGPSGGVARVPVDGSPPIVFVSTPTNMPGNGGALLVDSQSVYWRFAAPDLGIFKAGLDGSGTTSIVPSVTYSAARLPMAIDATDLYWVDQVASEDGGAEFAIFRTAK